MNRREALSTMAGGLAALLCPTWKIVPAKRRIDLAQFCCDYDSIRFDMKQPFRQEDWTYATDARVAVRVRPESGDKRDGEKINLPPAANLPWRHDSLRGWKPWPRVEVEYDMVTCEHDEGWYMCRQECEKCWGGEHGLRYQGPCDDPKCDDGWISPGKACPACKGTGKVPDPRNVQLLGVLVAGDYYQKVAALGDVEYATFQSERVKLPGCLVTEASTKIAFRFSEGVGLLMPIAS